MLTCCRYIGRLLIVPSLCCPHLAGMSLMELYHASALMPKTSSTRLPPTLPSPARGGGKGGGGGQASSFAAIFREISARHSSIGLKPGRVRQWVSVSRCNSSSDLSRSISKPQGCDTYHGVSQNISMRLPSGSWK